MGKIKDWLNKRKRKNYLLSLIKAKEELTQVQKYLKLVIESKFFKPFDMEKRAYLEAKKINQNILNAIIWIKKAEKNSIILEGLSSEIQSEVTLRTGRKTTLFSNDSFLLKNTGKYLDNCLNRIERIDVVDNFSIKKAKFFKKKVGEAIAFLQYLEVVSRKIINQKQLTKTINKNN